MKIITLFDLNEQLTFLHNDKLLTGFVSCIYTRVSRSCNFYSYELMVNNSEIMVMTQAELRTAIDAATLTTY